MGISCRNLEEVLRRIEEKRYFDTERPFFIPGIWHYEGFQSGTVAVNPYAYLSELIDRFIMKRADPKVEDYLPSIGLRDQNGSWLSEARIYCLDIRTAASWDYDGDGRLVEDHGSATELGTFLKTLLILPHIERLGLNVLYLLPVLKPSTAYLKGELGSFYAIKNFYELNPGLHDPMLDLPDRPFSLATEFRALMEACHLLGIRVVCDFPLRTASRDNDLMVEHPEWFYWVDKKNSEHYRVPYYPDLEEHVPPTPDRLHRMYPLPSTREYIGLFSFPPNELNPMMWEEVKREYSADPAKNILEMIEQAFGVTTAPAYSDWINDPQPAWDDITFLKLYLDPPAVRDGFFDGTEPPFLFFDAIKTNLYPGKVPNHPLWDYLAGIIRFHQEQFGIDGARIDMAHALPEQLEQLIMRRTLGYDRNFKFISEELQNANHTVAQRKGYHSIIGEIWSVEGRMTYGNLTGLLRQLPHLAVPSLACAETPDTPRAAVRHGERIFSRLAGVLNFFLPNSIPFVNNGFELYERQPMNLGLDNTEAGRNMLDLSDLYYGRLAFFDRFRFHWLNEGAAEMVSLIRRAGRLREEYGALLLKVNAFYLHPAAVEDVVQFGYRDTERELLCLVNLHDELERAIEVEGRLLISSAERELEKVLQPGEFRVYLLERR